MEPNEKKWIAKGVVAVIVIVAFMIVNPFSWNDATERTVVTQMSGKQFVQFQPGPFYSGFFSKEVVWPNQISVQYKEDRPDLDLVDNTVEIGRVKIRFNDATSADASGIAQFILPMDEEKMIEMHNAHRSPEALVQRRLAPYTQECIQSSAQLLSSEAHYSGGRAQMTQDYLDQLQNGAFLLQINEINKYDSIEKSNRKIYQINIQKDKSGILKRKFSSIKEYGVNASDAQITDVDYETAVDSMLAKKIAAATKASVSKQELMTAQQQQLTAEAQGKKQLVDIEYAEKKKQMPNIILSQTNVETSKQYLIQQDIDLQSSVKESQKIKNYADANAYERAKAINADNGLQQKIDAYVKVQSKWAEAFSAYGGNIVPLYQTGGSSGNGAVNFMELMGMKAAKDLNLDLKTK